MKTVLIIEDDTLIAHVIGEVLHEEGYRVVTAPDGREGLKCVREVKPDMVLSNVHLPHVSGLEIARAVKIDPALLTIPVVLMSADWEPGATGFFADYLHKPFSLEGLLQTVETQIGPPRE